MSEDASWMKEEVEEKPSAWTYVKRFIDPATRQAEKRKLREVNKRLRDIYQESGLTYGEDVDVDGLSDRFQQAMAMRKKNIRKVFNNIRQARDVDLCFVVDITGSMQAHITAVKNSIETIVNSLKSPPLKSNRVANTLRVAMVGYRDFGDAKKLEILDFTDSVADFQKFCGDLVAYGGGDTPEDVFSGIEKALTLDWSDVRNTKLIFHIADAPCHGEKYHNYPLSDTYPMGDPDGRSEKELFGTIVDKGIDYYFGKINSYTDQMIQVFAKAYGKDIMEFDIKDVTDITKSVITATTESVFTTINATTLTSEISRKDRSYTIVKTVPIWETVALKEGRFLSYELPTSIEDVINDVPLTRNPPKKALIKIADHPFAHGAERYAFYGQDLTTSPSEAIVLKEYRHTGVGMNTPARYEATNQIQSIASFFAAKFLEAIENSGTEFYNLKFLKVKTLAIQDKPGLVRYMSCEKRFECDDQFVRFTNNTGYEIMESTAEKYKIDMEYVRYLMAFSHWTYQVTNGNLMIVDLQGICRTYPTGKKAVILTDPAIHCSDETRFGRMNLGKGGMQNFFERHQCNKFCEALKLETVEPNPSWMVL